MLQEVKGQVEVNPCFSKYPQGYAIDEIKLISKSWKPKRLMGPKVHQDGFKQANSLKGRSAVASMR